MGKKRPRWLKEHLDSISISYSAGSFTRPTIQRTRLPSSLVLLFVWKTKCTRKKKVVCNICGARTFVSMVIVTTCFKVSPVEVYRMYNASFFFPCYCLMPNVVPH